MDDVLGIVVVGNHAPVINASIRAALGLRCAGFDLINAEGFDDAIAVDAVDNPVLSEVRSRALTFLNGCKRPVRAMLLTAPTLEATVRKLAEHRMSVRLGLLIVHSGNFLPAPHTPNCLGGSFEAFFGRLEATGVRFVRSPDSIMVVIPRADYDALPYQASLDYRVRAEPAEDWILDADLTICITNYIQLCHTSPLAQRRMLSRKSDASLGVYLTALMQSRFGRSWLLSYYTGTIVSSLIKTLQNQADALGVRSVRGPNEHSLACASFINWRLYRRGYLMVLTSAMTDELKGTLANLQQAGARGIIVCGDALPTKWFGFQATVNTDADIRKLLAARGIPFVYLQDGADVAPGLEAVATMLDQAAGPVVIVAAQPALEAISAEAPAIPTAEPKPNVRVSEASDARIEKVVRIVNAEPAHLLWQCGALSEPELELVLNIAEGSGIGLCDSLSAPGFVPTYRNGKPVSSYIGMLGQYGTNPEVYEFLQSGSDFNPRESQWLFVLKGKLGQIDSPYSDSAHANKLRIVQVNRRPDHIGPFADIGLEMPLIEFLERISRRLEVSPPVLEMRRKKIQKLKQRGKNVIAEVASLPMHPQYFFSRLSQVVRELIVSTGYRYAGMFDVGHCGTLGVSWLPRTDPSFSGWYGRGLMGDALLGAAALATTGENNVIAIIGDGARHMVPDITPNLIENISALARPIGRNVTIFFLVNNALSVINSYQERIMYQHGGRQMLVHNMEAFSEHDAMASVGGTTVCRKRLTTFDSDYVRNAISESNRVNLFSVPVALSNDGIAIVDRHSWLF